MELGELQVTVATAVAEPYNTMLRAFCTREKKETIRSYLVLVLYLSLTCMHVCLQIPVGPCLALVLHLIASGGVHANGSGDGSVVYLCVCDVACMLKERRFWLGLELVNIYSHL